MSRTKEFQGASNATFAPEAPDDLRDTPSSRKLTVENLRSAPVPDDDSFSVASDEITIGQWGHNRTMRSQLICEITLKLRRQRLFHFVKFSFVVSMSFNLKSFALHSSWLFLFEAFRVHCFMQFCMFLNVLRLKSRAVDIAACSELWTLCAGAEVGSSGKSGDSRRKLRVKSKRLKHMFGKSARRMKEVAGNQVTTGPACSRYTSHAWRQTAVSKLHWLLKK